MTSCSIEGCEKQFYARTWCRMHYARWMNTGRTDLVPRVRKERGSCSVDGCEKVEKTRGMCGMHTERVRNGVSLDPLPLTFHGVPFAERYQVSPSTGCWEWIAGRTTTNYGSYGRLYAHRVSYEMHVGPIPDGFHIDHLCRNTLCVNPQHLEPVPPRENMLRGFSPGALAIRLNRCKRGHEFTPENTYIRKDTGFRNCKKCHALAESERTRRNAA